eukprot:scaffold306_cov525-Prasinococcus_capsulatus_cf.AAC.32
MSSSLAPGMPNAIFSRTVASNNTGSCPTSPICLRRYCTLNWEISTPSMVMLPAVASYRRCSRATTVDLPQPL